MLVADPAIPQRHQAVLQRAPYALIPAHRELSDHTRPWMAALDSMTAAVEGVPGVGPLLVIPIELTVDLFHNGSYAVDRLARRYHRRYLTGSDVDAEARVLVLRAQTAVHTVMTSNVNRLGMIDVTANKLALPQQVWEIGLMAHRQAALRWEQQSISRAEMTPSLAAVVGPQRKAIERSVAQTTKRVEMLEEYARRVRQADSSLLAQQMLANNDKYRDLLAQTDDTQGIVELAEESRRVETTLRESVLAAVEAGKALALPADETEDLTDPGGPGRTGQQPESPE